MNNHTFKNPTGLGKKKMDYLDWALGNLGKVALVLFVLVPIAINLLFLISNFIYMRSGINISAFDLTNRDWFVFWGTYLGGIATMGAVLLTLKQTKDNHEAIIKEQDRQRKLDVLPVIILQPRITEIGPDLAIMVGAAFEEKTEQLVPIDELKSTYKERDLDEIYYVIDDEGIHFQTFITERQKERIRNKGHVSVKEVSTGRYIGFDAYTSIIMPMWFTNAGKEAAINIRLELISPHDKCYFKRPFSLLAKEKIKIYILVDISNDKVETIFGKYRLIIRYSNIFSNSLSDSNTYCQTHQFELVKHENGVFFSFDYTVNQIEGSVDKTCY